MDLIVLLEWQLLIGISMAIWLMFYYKWNKCCVEDTFNDTMVYNLNNQYTTSSSQNSLHEACICNITHCAQRKGFINERSGNVSADQFTQWASVGSPHTHPEVRRSTDWLWAFFLFKCIHYKCNNLILLKYV